MIVVDTSVLSHVYRRLRLVGPEKPEVRELRRLLIMDVPFFVPGAAYQQLLSGVREREHFERLLALTTHLPVRLATLDDHVLAASISNLCRKNGIATDPVDCVIAAQALSTDAELLTLDEDFERMAPLCELRLWKVRR